MQGMLKSDINEKLTNVCKELLNMPKALKTTN